MTKTQAGLSGGKPWVDTLVVKAPEVARTVAGSRYCRPTMTQVGSTSAGVTSTVNTESAVGSWTATEYREPLGEGRGLGEGVLESLGPRVEVGLSEGLPLPLGLGEGVVVRVLLPLGLVLGLGPGLVEVEREGVWDGVSLPLGLPLLLGLEEGEGEVEREGVVDRVTLPLGLEEGEDEVEREGDWDGLPLRLPLPLLLGLEEGEDEEEGVVDGVTLPLGL